jgi:hypothetical protein
VLDQVAAAARRAPADDCHQQCGRKADLNALESSLCGPGSPPYEVAQDERLRQMLDGASYFGERLERGTADKGWPSGEDALGRSDEG